MQKFWGVNKVYYGNVKVANFRIRSIEHLLEGGNKEAKMKSFHLTAVHIRPQY